MWRTLDGRRKREAEEDESGKLYMGCCLHYYVYLKVNSSNPILPFPLSPLPTPLAGLYEHKIGIKGRKGREGKGRESRHFFLSPFCSLFFLLLSLSLPFFFFFFV